MESGAKGAEVRTMSAITCPDVVRVLLLDKAWFVLVNLVRRMWAAIPNAQDRHLLQLYYRTPHTLGCCRRSLVVGTIQVIVAGKLRAQRAKAMKFRDGYMIKSGRVREGEWSVWSAVFFASSGLPQTLGFSSAILSRVHKYPTEARFASALRSFETRENQATLNA